METRSTGARLARTMNSDGVDSAAVKDDVINRPNRPRLRRTARLGG